MEQGQAVRVTPTDAELERAISSVPGVVSAGIDRSEETGRSRLRLRLAPGEDQEAVGWAVAATLRERFGIALDPGAIRPRETARPDPADDPVQVVEAPDQQEAVPGHDLVHPSGDGRSGTVPVPPATDPHPRVRGRTSVPRAEIRDLQVQRDARRVEVAVVLEYDGRTEEGRASSVPTSHGTLRAVAEATVASLRALSPGPLLIGIDRVAVRLGVETPLATVGLSLLTHRGEEQLLGAVIVRDGAERAVVRATLDALNRRVSPMLLRPEPGCDHSD